MLLPNIKEEQLEKDILSVREHCRVSAKPLIIRNMVLRSIMSGRDVVVSNGVVYKIVFTSIGVTGMRKIWRVPMDERFAKFHLPCGLA